MSTQEAERAANAASTPGETVRLTVGQAITVFLQAQWTEFEGQRQRTIPGVFGIFGHGNVAGIGQALEERGTDLVFHQGKNEQSMVHAAIGFAKASRRLSTLAVSASIGPGCTNLVTGAATATVNRLPVLLFASDTFANRRQGPVLQALEHPTERDATVNDTLRPVSRFFDRIARPEQILTALPEAFRVLLDPAETGAVTLSVHQDVQGEAFDCPVDFLLPRTWRVVRRPPAAEEIETAARLIEASERPMIISGGGVIYSDASAELARFSEQFGIPVAETYGGKGSMPEGGELLGGMGMAGSRAANRIAHDADLVLCVGTRLTDLITGSHSVFQNPDVRFVDINVGAADANKLSAAPVVADAKLALGALTEALSERGWEAGDAHRERVSGAVATWQSELAKDLAERPDERMSQAQVIERLNGLSGPGDLVIGGAGTVPVDMLKVWDCTNGSECHLEFGFSCMGHELPAGIGVRLARPEAGEIYVFIGDGNYLMANSELVTAVQEGLKITVVLVENGGHQSIHALQRSTTGATFGTEYRHRAADGLTGDYVQVDFASNARSYGCAAFEANTLDEFEKAVADARADTRPTMIVAHVEPLRLMLDSDAWWDVGVAQVAERESTREVAASFAQARAEIQRDYVRPADG